MPTLDRYPLRVSGQANLAALVLLRVSLGGVFGGVARNRVPAYLRDGRMPRAGRSATSSAPKESR